MSNDRDDDNDDRSDDEALTDIRHGGRRGFVILYQRYELKLYYYVISKGVPEADREDVSQEIFFQFFKTLIKGTFKQTCSLSTWLYEITKNIVADYWRKRQRTPSHLESLSPNEEVEEENNPFFNQLSEEQSAKTHHDLECQLCIERILQRLNRSDDKLCQCLKVLIWHVIEGKSLLEIATLINRSPVQLNNIFSNVLGS